MPPTDTLDSLVEEASLHRLACELVRIPSVAEEEGELAAHLASYLEGIGFEVELQDVHSSQAFARRSNVIARAGAGGPALLLSGHTDVVPPGTGWSLPPYAGEVRDGRLYGRGAADMKGGIASMVEAASAFRRSRLMSRGRVVLAFVVGEEVDQAGTRALVDGSKVDCDFAIVGEPTELAPIVCHKGLIAVTITVSGQASHASRPQEGRNAIDGMHALLDGLRPLRERLSRRGHPLTGPATLTPGTIRGGEVSNMVPAECTLELDRRLLPGETAEAALGEIEEVVGAVRAANPGLGYTVRSGLVEAPMEISEESPIVLALRRAGREVEGRDPGTQGWTATCDAGLLSSESGIATVVYGPGSLSQAHRPDESVALGELTTAARIYARVISELFNE